MQCLGLFVVLVLGCSLVAAQSPYTTKYDNVDVDKILKNERVLTNYIKCLMEEGPCTPEGRELRSKLRCVYHLPFLHFNVCRNPARRFIQRLLQVQRKTERHNREGHQAFDG